MDVEAFKQRAKTQSPVRLTRAERDELEAYAQSRGPTVAARFREQSKLGKFVFVVDEADEADEADDHADDHADVFP